MNHHTHRVWHRFEQDIVAVNDIAALKLLSFLRYVQRNDFVFNTIEIFDLQRYKLITKKNLVRSMLHLPPKDMVFIFPVSKN